MTGDLEAWNSVTINCRFRNDVLSDRTFFVEDFKSFKILWQ